MGCLQGGRPRREASTAISQLPLARNSGWRSLPVRVLTLRNRTVCLFCLSHVESHPPLGSKKDGSRNKSKSPKEAVIEILSEGEIPEKRKSASKVFGRSGGRETASRDAGSSVQESRAQRSANSESSSRLSTASAKSNNRGKSSEGELVSKKSSAPVGTDDFLSDNEMGGTAPTARNQRFKSKIAKDDGAASGSESPTEKKRLKGQGEAPGSGSKRRKTIVLGSDEEGTSVGKQSGPAAVGGKRKATVTDLFDFEFSEKDSTERETAGRARAKIPISIGANSISKRGKTEGGGALSRHDSFESSTDREILPDEYFDSKESGEQAPLKRTPSWPRNRRSLAGSGDGAEKRDRTETIVANTSESDASGEGMESSSDEEFAPSTSLSRSTKRRGGPSVSRISRTSEKPKKTSSKATAPAAEVADNFWTKEVFFFFPAFFSPRLLLSNPDRSLCVCLCVWQNVERLFEIVGRMKPGTRTFWDDVADHLPGTTAGMCRTKFEAQHATPKIFPKASSRRKADNKSATAATVADMLGWPSHLFFLSKPEI